MVKPEEEKKCNYISVVLKFNRGSKAHKFLTSMAEDYGMSYNSIIRQCMYNTIEKIEKEKMLLSKAQDSIIK